MKHDDLYEMIDEMGHLENKCRSTAKEVGEKRAELRTLAQRHAEAGNPMPEGMEPYKYLLEEDEEGEYKPTPYAQYLYRYMREPHVAFYFDDTVTFSQNLVDTGKEFFMGGALKLPYDRCFFYAPKLTDEGFALWMRKESDKIVLNFESKNPQPISLDIVVAEDGSYIGRDIGLEGTPQITDKDDFDALQYAVEMFYQLLISLNHPVYEQEFVKAAEKVNKVREDKGKRKLIDFITVKMNAKVKQSLGTHADGTIRVPHWRRGHLRRLSSGRITSVRPCMVNWRGEDIQPKDYKIAA